MKLIIKFRKISESDWSSKEFDDPISAAKFLQDCVKNGLIAEFISPFKKE